MSKKFSIRLDDVAATEALGATIASMSAKGDVIFLTGELGAGKTALTRGYLRYFFQNPELDVPSPSYLLHFVYANDVPEEAQAELDMENQGKANYFSTGRFAQLPGVPIHHLDPYRLPVGKIASLIEFETIWKEGISLVEWPEKLGPQLVTESYPPRMEITISGIGPQSEAREATFSAIGDRWQKVLESWTTDDAGYKPVQCATLTVGTGPAMSSTAPSLNPKKQEIVEDGKLLILGIESSCDDTGAAVVNGDGQILGEALASQNAVHQEWGGVVPKLAQEEHKKNIDGTVETALERAKIVPEDLTAIAVTVGPGLSMCLEVGVRKAYALAAKYCKPILRIHHMEAHAMITRMPSLMKLPPGEEPPSYPYLTVLVSGGHNMVVYSEDIGKHHILGQSMDDSIGEAFDKTARLLGIQAVPGGPALERMAATGNDKTIRLPKPLERSRDPQIVEGCDFSFSGLKTSVRSLIEKQKELTDEYKANIAASFQRTAVEHLIDRTTRALGWAMEMAQDQEKALSALVVAGGVAANKLVRSELEKMAIEASVPLLVPPPKYCVDNGVMVAWTGVERYRRGLWEHPPSSEEKAKFYSEILPRWPLGTRDVRSKGKAVAKASKRQNEERAQKYPVKRPKIDETTNSDAAVAEKEKVDTVENTATTTS